MPYLITLFVLFLSLGCSSVQPPLPLQGTYWSLTALGDDDIESYDSQPPLHLVFHLNDKTVHGSDGCNRFHGSFTNTDDAIEFTQMASTRMFCVEGAQQSQQFMLALTKSSHWKILEDQLFLYDSDNILLAQFEAQIEH